MADRDLEQDDPRLSAAARHALHDEELIAAFAVDGDEAEDVSRARSLIERCAPCRDLHADIVAIGSAISMAPTAEVAGAVQRAPRDFRLRASDAVRLRGGNVLQRVAARLADGSAGSGRPVGASLAALGVVGLLVGTLALAPLGSPASMSTESTGGAGTAPAATGDLQAAGNQSPAPSGDRAVFGPDASARDKGGLGSVTLDDGRPGPALLALLFGGSIALLVLGTALLIGGARQRGRPGAPTTTRT